MKKLLLFFAAIMMASTGLWAQKTVKYIDADGQEKTVDAIEVEEEANAVTWGTANTTTWYVVTNDVTLDQGAICVGNVNLILADDKKLSATASGQAAIQVSGEGNSLTIYGQVNQTGQLEAICEFGGAGIGGGSGSSGSNITINGGMITAIADENNASAIGNGSVAKTPASNIKVSTKLIVKAGTDEEHAEAIATTRSDDTDIASELKEKHYVSIKSIRTATYTYIDENGESQEVVATEVESSYTPVTWNGGWYVVDDANVLHKGAICQGDVRLILADGAKLTTTGYRDDDDENMSYAGIQVSGEGNSLTIYGQAAQTGQLEANGGGRAAGIGGGYRASGSNITINGGVVTANASDAAGIGGGDSGAGFNITINRGNVTANSNKGAGIGGGYCASGSNITINGGMITATSNWGAGIGGGYMGSGSNIRVATTLLVKADNNNPPTEEIEHDGGCDIAGKLKDRRYVTTDSILPFRNAAIATIYAVGKDYNNEIIKAIAETAKTDIEAATTTNAINSIKEKALADLQYALALYDAGKTEVLGTLGEKQTGPAVEVIDQDDNSVILYNPKKVNFIKVETEE